MASQVEQLHSRAVSLAAQFAQGNGTNYIDEAIVLDREALDLCPPDHPNRTVSLTWLAIHLSTRHKQLGRVQDLDEAIVVEQEALELCPKGHPRRSLSSSNLAIALSTRYEQLSRMQDLDDAILLGQEALELRPQGHPDRSTSLNNLATYIFTRHEQLGGMKDLDEAVMLDQEALELRPKGHPDRSMSLSNLGNHLSTRYEQLGRMEDLEKAIILARESLELCPQGHPCQSDSLNNLATHLSARYNQLGRMKDLDEAIVLDQEALELRPKGHPDRSMSLNNHAIHLSSRYEQLGGMEDLEKAIMLARESLELRPQGHPDRPGSLNNLGLHLSTLYSRLGGIQYLNEAVDIDREALELRPQGHPDRTISLNNLAIHLAARYTRLGGMQDLDEAILHNREALGLFPQAHPDRALSLANLGLDLWTRYNKLGGMQDLDEAIVLTRNALELCPQGHSDRPGSLNNLGLHLSTRYKQLRSMQDLDEAIMLHREALELRPPGNPDRAMSLINLGHLLWTHYDQLGGMQDLDEAIILDREALELCPQGHPDRSGSLTNLALHLSTRSNQLGGTQDLDEAIGLDRKALELCPQGHPDRSMPLNNLALHLHTRFRQSSESKDKEELFNIYAELVHTPQMVSSLDLSAVKEWIHAAEQYHHPSTVLAYETYLRLLSDHLASLPSLSQHLSILKKVTTSLAVDAFSACLRNSTPARAVELLEQGRGVFWGQLTRLHSPLDDVIASGSAGKMLADEFSHSTSLIRDALNSPDTDQHGLLCHLNLQLKTVVDNIRALPRFSHFLLPPFFSDLQRAASEGPVIIVNSSQYGCDAVVVLLDHDPVHIPLQVTQEAVRDLSKEIKSMAKRAKKMDMTKPLGFFLRRLWEQVVSPIVVFLQTCVPTESRIWWCPTGEFTSLPLHAAGPQRKGQPNLPQLYVSSYTPTLSALIRARRVPSFGPTNTRKHFVAVGQANAVGETQLVSVASELENIGERVGRFSSFTQIEGAESTISRVEEELGKNEWVHFACHGLANQEAPFESAFALQDGHFTIEQIIRCELDNPEFAYLSACHTTVGDEESPDEVIHLASAMQFIGFRSVIGTMWAVDDEETNKITSMFYENMVKERGCLDHTQAAYALNKTMRTVKGIPLDQRVLYIHLGA